MKNTIIGLALACALTSGQAFAESGNDGGHGDKLARSETGGAPPHRATAYCKLDVASVTVDGRGGGLHGSVDFEFTQMVDDYAHVQSSQLAFARPNADLLGAAIQVNGQYRMMNGFKEISLSFDPIAPRGLSAIVHAALQGDAQVQHELIASEDDFVKLGTRFEPGKATLDYSKDPMRQGQTRDLRIGFAPEQFEAYGGLEYDLHLRCQFRSWNER